jgi:malonate transporter and related proteins
VASVLSGFLPIWVVAALGWVAGRFNVLGAGAQGVLGRFAFSFAMPSLLFLTLSRSRVGEVANRGVVAFAASLVVVFAAGLLLSRLVFRRRQAETAIGAMTAAYVNSANLGIPVAVHVLRDTSFIVTAALFQMLFITPTILVLIDLDVREGTGPRWGRMLQLPFRNPIIAGSAAGVVVSALGWHLPSQVVSPLQTLGGAAVPSALFALGMSLNGRVWPEPGGRLERVVMVSLKIVAQPLAAYALGRWVFGLGGHALFPVVLCAGLPTAQNAFIFASEYGLDTDLPRDTILLSTLLSMVSLSLITWMLA